MCVRTWALICQEVYGNSSVLSYEIGGNLRLECERGH